MHLVDGVLYYSSHCLSQVSYTAQYSTLQGADGTDTPGYWQQHAYYWLLMTKETLKTCFPETYRRHSGDLDSSSN